MAKKNKINEPMLEEKSSGAMLEESTASDTLLEETSNDALLEETTKANKELFEQQCIESYDNACQMLDKNDDIETINKVFNILDQIDAKIQENKTVGESLDHIRYWIECLKLFTQLFYIPEHRKEAFQKLQTQDDQNYFVSLGLFYGYAFAVDGKTYPDQAFKYAQQCLDFAEEDSEKSTALLAIAKCLKEGWGQENPDCKTAKVVVADAMSKRKDEDYLSWELDIIKEIQEAKWGSNKSPEDIVKKLIEDLVEGFEIVHVFSKNESYKVCRYLITQEEWEVIMGENPSHEKGYDLPVTNITLNEAEIFVQKVNMIAFQKFPIYGVSFSIPDKNVQWHGYQKKFFSSIGKESLDIYCWHKDNCEGHLQPVGKLHPAAGIYDACGLVYEWCTMKKFDSLFGGSILEPPKMIEPKLGNSSSLKYRIKRYDDVGLRLISMCDN